MKYRVAHDHPGYRRPNPYAAVELEGVDGSDRCGIQGLPVDLVRDQVIEVDDLGGPDLVVYVGASIFRFEDRVWKEYRA